ncbi:MULTISPECIES: bacteriocin [Lactococcus]|uniref:Uncharacterized protein n=1 Tax=Lactococcus garvieae TaxID=1363 RepID=H2AM33_9LACT|nr:MULTISPECIES: bacteriocin [Lactococcus]BAV03490.1 hypothetical protein NALG_1976 [Lactococcus formosensis]BDW50314.1 hypothetical protein LG21E20_19760 [Lactococcus formosensis]CCF55365.1 hypothetical protein [Lactococcus garvieae]
MDNKSYVELSNEELQKINGGIGGALGNALAGLGNGLKQWNTTGFSEYNIGGGKVNNGKAPTSIPAYNPYGH